MGTYLNPSRQNFQISVNSKIFVDKSEMIGFLNTLVNTQERYVSVSRPRRFGKTMAADMICAYYGREADSRELFTKLKISHLDAVETKTGTIGWDCYLGRFDVIHIVMTRFFKAKTSVEKALEKLQMMVIRDLKKPIRKQISSMKRIWFRPLRMSIPILRDRLWSLLMNGMLYFV
ncbi:MAG: AAA family ATPase [Solobacterium sp.]|nr:AAA family ATPase [Solobacterium sp.]